MAWGKIVDISRISSKSSFAVEGKDQITEIRKVNDYTEAVERLIRFLSTEASSVLPTNEELIVARATADLLEKRKSARD